MKENEVKNAFEEIEPGHGAQERMYANILKKAAAQKQNGAGEPPVMETKPAAPKHRTTPLWRRWGSLAACLAVVLAVSLVLPRIMNSEEANDPPVMGGSPVEDVSGPEEFEKLGFTIDAPEGAENVTYCIYDGTIARVDFMLNGHAYTYEAAKLDGNFSRAEGEAVGSVSLNAQYDATLDRLAPDTWRAHWSRGDVSCYLTNFDGAEEAAITGLADTLMGNN